MRDFFARRWFLLALALLLGSGLLWPAALEPLARAIPQRVVVAAALFFMALPLDARSIWTALSRPAAVLLAVAINFGLLPLAAWGASQAFRADLAGGLMIVAAVPSTIASAAVLTRRAGGNDAVAILVTMITSLSCFIITPLWLLIGTGTRVELELGSMMLNLASQVVLPIIVAQALRQNATVGQAASHWKIPLGVVAQCGILLIAGVGAISAGLSLQEGGDVSWQQWGLLFAALLGIHLAMIWAGHALGRPLGVARAERIAVGFSGSQKTLMIGLYLAVNYYGGLSMLPMVIYHVGQLLIDTLIADQLRAQQASSPEVGQIS